MFFDIVECDIASYADDNTPYSFDFNLDNVINNLEKSNSLLNCLRENHMKANANKCHLLVSSDESCTTKIGDFTIKNRTKEKLLGDLILIFLLKVISHLFVKRQARNYTLLQEYHLAWT